jgi:hypothetical protein
MSGSQGSLMLVLASNLQFDWIPVNQDTSELQYFAPVKRLSQMYQAARKG